jgi:hypothetical protein
MLAACCKRVCSPLIDRTVEGILEHVVVRLRAQFDDLLENFNVTRGEADNASRDGFRRSQASLKSVKRNA